MTDDGIMVIMMILTLVVVVLLVGVLGWAAVAARRKARQANYYEVTLFLGSGGHTGQLCQMLHNFRMHKVSKLNVLITSTDKNSQHFFQNYVRDDHAQQQSKILGKTSYYLIQRTNEVKQSKLTALFTTIRSFLSSLFVIVKHLLNTTHFISNGPGSSVPLFLVFFMLKKLRLATTKLIFIQSWCRVEDLSLTGKIVRHLVDEFVVHWPELAAKYKNCKYYERIV